MDSSAHKSLMLRYETYSVDGAGYFRIEFGKVERVE